MVHLTDTGRIYIIKTLKYGVLYRFTVDRIPLTGMTKKNQKKGTKKNHTTIAKF